MIRIRPEPPHGLRVVVLRHLARCGWELDAVRPGLLPVELGFVSETTLIQSGSTPIDVEVDWPAVFRARPDLLPG